MMDENPDFPPAAGHRFHVPAPGWTSDILTLTGGEGRHCAEVLRHREGDRVTAFDGEGREAACSVKSIGRREVTLEIVSTRIIPPPKTELVLIQAIAKTKAMDWLVQKACEVGVTRIVPVTTSRTVVKVRANESGKFQDKWSRIALETAKQCTRAWLPRIEAPQSLVDYLGSGESHGAKLIASLGPQTESLRSAIGSAARVTSAAVLIGPEGDFTPEESEAAIGCGYTPVTLGPNVLRSETAAIYCLSVLAYELCNC